MTILEKLAEHAMERVKLAERSVSLEAVREQAMAMEKGSFGFEKVEKAERLLTNP